ncbi:MAG: hypothetical protein LBP25_03815 [Tannerellaceae bacterium]|jgi:hypothetical protein|nr:hypothetical protein [Tannerellaceae bacterium]
MRKIKYDDALHLIYLSGTIRWRAERSPDYQFLEPSDRLADVLNRIKDCKVNGLARLLPDPWEIPERG